MNVLVIPNTFVAAGKGDPDTGVSPPVVPSIASTDTPVVPSWPTRTYLPEPSTVSAIGKLGMVNGEPVIGVKTPEVELSE